MNILARNGSMCHSLSDAVGHGVQGGVVTRPLEFYLVVLLLTAEDKTSSNTSIYLSTSSTTLLVSLSSHVKGSFNKATHQCCNEPY